MSSQDSSSHEKLPERTQSQSFLESLKNILDILALFLVLLSSLVTTNDAYFAIGVIVFSIFAIVAFIVLRKNLSKRRQIFSIVCFFILVILVIPLHNLMLWPQPEISLISSARTPTCFFGIPIFPSPVTFEVTNSLINASTEILDPNNKYHIQKAGLSLEILPNFSADRQYGRVILRISGKGSKVIDKLLWDDFKKDVPSQHVEISMSELVAVSDIQLNSMDIESNLMAQDASFQKSSITLKVIRATDPNHPFGCPVNIDIFNTPWRQQAETVSRDKHFYIDYFLKNSGVEGDFGYAVNLSRIDKPVGDSVHPVWSGTTGLPTGLYSDFFHLKNGESITKSIQMNDDLPKGRYVAEIYTYKKLDYIEFNSSAQWKNYDVPWLFANDGDRFVWVICNDPGKNCTDSAAYPIEQGNPTAYAYDGKEQARNGYAGMTVNSYPALDHIVNRYKIDYWIDPKSEGWAGLSLDFNDRPLDVKDYRSIRFTIQLQDDKSPLLMTIYNEANRSISEKILLGDGNYGKASSGEQTIEIPTSAFQKIDFSKITRITFSANNDLVQDDRQHQFQISQIEFFGMK
jgi:hypothetical protein